jgi:exodeoxyribonuclease VII small subunit
MTADLAEPADAAGSAASIRYVDAMAELEAILAELEGDDVDVDILATKVARASELIRLCRGRLSDARVRVEQVVADLDAVERG